MKRTFKGGVLFLDDPIYMTSPCINADFDQKLRTEDNYLGFKRPVLMDTFERVQFVKGFDMVKTVCQNMSHDRVSYKYDINSPIYLN